MKQKVKLNKSKMDKNLVKVKMFPKLLTIMLVVVVLIGIGIYYNISSTGKAREMGEFTTFQTPQPLQELDSKEGFQVDTTIVREQTFTVSNSKEGLGGYKINFTVLDNGMMQYNLYRLEGNKYVLEEWGLLNDALGSVGGIFLDEDTVADLRMEYKDGVVMVLNMNYIEPEYSTITVLDSSMKVVTEQLIFVQKDQKVEYYFNVSSTKTPKVTAQWKNGADLGESEFAVSSSGEDFVTMKLMFTPTEDKPYVLLVNASVDDKSVVKQYVLAARNIVYVLDEEKSPMLAVKTKKDKNYEFNFTFRGVMGLQAFSLPCGDLDLSGVDTSNIMKIYGYDDGVQQWVEGVPSDFDILKKGKGYALTLKDKDKPLSLVGSCGTIGALGLPEGLKDGWNLVGVKGVLQDVPQAMLKKMPMLPGKTVKYVFVIENDGEKLYEGNLQPGKAYWVKVE